MLQYDKKPKEITYPRLQEAKKQNAQSVAKKSFFWLRLVLQFVINLATSIITNSLTPGLGIILDYFISQITDLLLNFFFNDFKIDWKEFGLTSLMNSIPFITRGIKFIAKAKSVNRFYSLADNLVDKSLASNLKGASTKLSNFGLKEVIFDSNLVSKIKLPGKVANYKLFDSANAKALTALLKSNTAAFKATKTQSKIAFNFIKAKLKTVGKAFNQARTAINLLTSPRYAAKRLVQFILKKPYSAINKTWNKWIDSKLKTAISKQTKSIFSKSIQNIPLNSHWLKSLKIHQSGNPWNIKIVNAILTFKPSPNGKSKEPVLLWQKSLDEVLRLTTTTSPGAYYLKEFAWGWSVGKILRKHNEFLTMSKLPLYSDLVSSFFYGVKTIESIVRTIGNFKKENFLETFKTEVFEGFKDGSLKGLKPKYLTPLVAIARSSVTKNTSFVIKQGLNLGGKLTFRTKIKKTLKKRRNNKW